MEDEKCVLAAAEERRWSGHDLTQKKLEAYSDVFADVLNALIYKGKQVVAPTSLRAAPTETFYRALDGRLRDQMEDIGQYEVDRAGKNKILYLLANQMIPDYKMVLRKCGYVGGYYRSQYELKKADICPVVELVLYWGTKPWESAFSIHHFFQKKKLASEVWDYIDDDRVHVFNMRNLPEEVVERFRGDMKLILLCLTNPAKAEKSSQIIEHPIEFLEFIRVLTGDERYGQMLNMIDNQEIDLKPNEGGQMAMCVLMDKYWEGGRQEGMQEGIRALISTCKELGESFESTAARIKKMFSIGDAEVQRDMKLYW